MPQHARAVCLAFARAPNCQNKLMLLRTNDNDEKAETLAQATFSSRRSKSPRPGFSREGEKVTRIHAEHERDKTKTHTHIMQAAASQQRTCSLDADWRHVAHSHRTDRQDGKPEVASPREHVPPEREPGQSGLLCSAKLAVLQTGAQALLVLRNPRRGVARRGLAACRVT